MAEVVFTRRSSEQGEVFEVRPAPQSKVYTFFVLGCGLAMLANCSGMATTMKFSGAIFSVLIGLGIAALSGYVVWRDISNRRTVTIVASPKGLNVDGSFQPIDNIADVYLKSPNSSEAPVSSAMVVGGTGLAGMGMAVGAGAAQIGASVKHRQQQRRYSLELRMKNISAPIQIVYGLTREAGLALLNDLGRSLAASQVTR